MILFVWSATKEGNYIGPYMVIVEEAIEAEEWADIGYGAVASTNEDYIKDAIGPKDVKNG